MPLMKLYVLNSPLAHTLTARIKYLEKNRTQPWVRPDGKTQFVNKRKECFNYIWVYMHVFYSYHYATGLSHPLAITVFHYGTSDRSEELLEIIQKNFDLCLGAITVFLFSFRELDLKRPIYRKTAYNGHFGREEFTWEIPKKLVY
ncbi:hypothetical protein ASZ78_002431 [Callipepla squamata]|uniref:S-adenosylmethionine synthetase C-terminal domain-containing protein n=1 Tax=Callipepla squamata TaxID=9009 RepID=A0A226MJA4_CALSU|nr:hypothetical protein ASZ78_002431 [Callipepla squamata]